MTMATTTETPLVRLGDVAPYLVKGDRFEWNGRPCVVHCVEPTAGSVLCGVHEIPFDAQIEPISPRLVPVPVGETIPAGTPWADLRKDDWSGFEPLRIDWKVQDQDSACYRLSRDPAPRRATRADVREGMRVRIWSRGYENHVMEGTVSGLSSRGFYVGGLHWLLGGEYSGSPVEILAEPEPREFGCPDPSQPAPATEPATCSKCGLPETTERHVGYHHDWLCDECAAGERKMATEPAKAEPERCRWCKEPFWAGRKVVNERKQFCGDCESERVLGRRIEPLDTRIAAVCQPDPEPNPHGANRANFLHHLRDDLDVWGV